MDITSPTDRIYAEARPLHRAKGEFKRFLRLPAELRLIVWKWYVLGRRQIIEVHCNSFHAYAFHVQSFPCCEAMDTAFRKYDKDKRYQHLARLRGAGEYGSKLYFDPKVDIFYFPYRFNDATTYGLLLQGFLHNCGKWGSRFFVRRRNRKACLSVYNFGGFIRHLALSVPTKSASGTPAEFIREVQRIARREGNLCLKTFNIVFNDPIATTRKKRRQNRTYEIGDVGLASRFIRISQENETCAVPIPAIQRPPRADRFPDYVSKDYQCFTPDPEPQEGADEQVEEEVDGEQDERLEEQLEES
ncbi:hypothetical protein DL95DRAFT_474567 [Leptodontidium sp. 2 PMI_412]|nr:hypothetical protein DL95DRAFT_474567 [Leptodontidium sp. 2 PMI_412]